MSTNRGSVFYLCQRAANDARYVRYPRLPVLGCAGHEPAPQESNQGKKDGG